MIFSFMAMDVKSHFLIESLTSGKCKNIMFSCYDWENSLKCCPPPSRFCAPLFPVPHNPGPQMGRDSQRWACPHRTQSVAAKMTDGGNELFVLLPLEELVLRCRHRCVFPVIPVLRPSGREAPAHLHLALGSQPPNCGNNCRL